MQGGTPDSTTSTVNFPSWLEPYIKQVAGSGENLFNQGVPAPYSGTGVAGFTPEQLTSQRSALSFADSYGEKNQPTMDALNKGLTVTNPYSKYLENGNPYLDKMVNTAQKGMADVFNTDVMRNIRDEAIGTGQQIGAGQSTYTQGLDAGTKNLTKSMGDVATNMYGAAYEGDMNRQLQGEGMGLDTMIKSLSMSPGIMAGNLTPSNIYGAVGTEKQSMNQAGINEAIKKWYEPYSSNMNWLKDFSGLFTGMSPGGTTTTTDNSSNNPFMQALGSGGMGYGMASLMGMSNPGVMAAMMAAPALMNY